MEWKDTGLVLAVRKHGETSAIVELMTEFHGRHLGLVRGGRSSRMRPVLQPGNRVIASWRARLEEHLGTYQIEPEELHAARLMALPLGAYGFQLMASHLRLLPERDAHSSLYRAALVLAEHFDEPEKAARMMIRFELAILEQLGFGLDLTRCAATGRTDTLGFVSPKSGRAVSREAGEPWRDRLLSLPEFLSENQMHDGETAAVAPSLTAGFRLTGHFLDRDVYGARGLSMPEERAAFIRKIERSLAAV